MNYPRQFIILTILLTLPLNILMAQREVSYRIVLDDQQVPKEVRAAFKATYPNTFMSIWYTSHITYWYEDYAPSWYGSWYPVRQTVVHKFEKPAYYEVDFQINNEPSRAIFSRYGQWFETRTRIKELPEPVFKGLRDSEFGEWMWSEHKERIEALGVDGYIYRLQVTNKRLSYIIRLNEFGEIVQVKYD
jgi:hypothetical protein